MTPPDSAADVRARLDRVRARLESFARTRLASLPTPLTPAPRLARELGRGAPILVKRDDETGFALGGNKVRKLEFELSPDRLHGVTHLITAGGPQSNHARVTAAAAARLGIECTLVINGVASDEPGGNALLHRLFGARLVHVGTRAERDQAMRSEAARVASQGGHALVVPLGASTPLGALGYVAAALELGDQLDSEAWSGPVRVYVASSSCGTLGGLAAGFAMLARDGVTLVGVSADEPRETLLAESSRLARGALDLLGASRPFDPGLVEADDTEVGEGYGVPTRASRDALSLFARSEGILLDPVYTAKAAAAMVRDARAGVSAGSAYVFVHTGGHPALFIQEG